MCFTMILLIVLAMCSLYDVRALHNLYFETVCKVHTSCIRMNIIYESLAKGREIACCIGRKVKKSMQLAACVTLIHVGGSALPPPQLRLATVVVMRLCLRLNT